MGTAVKNVASLILVGLTLVVAIAAMLIVVGWLGALLWPIAFIVLFLLFAIATGGAGMSGLTILVGIILMTFLGLGLHAVLGSVVGYDPAQLSYVSTMSAIRLSTVGYSVSDQSWNVIFGIIVLGIVIVFAFLGILMQGKKSR